VRAFDIGQHEGDPPALILPPSSQRDRFLTRSLSAARFWVRFPGGFPEILTQVFIRIHVAHFTVGFVFSPSSPSVEFFSCAPGIQTGKWNALAADTTSIFGVFKHLCTMIRCAAAG
jgi:hypothetical protein